ncbi:hypothetical protein [Flavobacterium sp. GSP14]|uniref:hypothetical protein n=1 Tax=Flavobacterium sp. GSP14 TaxID=3401734 RepID=UPI003AAB4C9A
METTNFELLQFLLNSVNDAQEEVTNHKDYNILKNNFHLLSDKNKYIMNTFRYYNKIADFNDDIKKVEFFLRRFPNPAPRSVRLYATQMSHDFAFFIKF